MPQKTDLTQGPVTKSMLLFALPMILGNLLQQFYNVADTLIVGPVSGVHGLGGGGLLLHADDLPHLHSAGDVHGQRGGVLHPLWGGRPAPAEKQPVPVLFADWRLYRGAECGGVFAHRPHDGAASGAGGRHPLMRSYLWVIFWGIGGTFLYNYFASLLRAVGNSATPLVFLGVSAVLNIVLDLVFVVAVPWGVAGRPLPPAFPSGCLGWGCWCTPGSAWPTCAPAARTSTGKRTGWGRLPGSPCSPACSSR